MNPRESEMLAVIEDTQKINFERMLGVMKRDAEIISDEFSHARSQIASIYVNKLMHSVAQIAYLTTACGATMPGVVHGNQDEVEKTIRDVVDRALIQMRDDVSTLVYKKP